jgi:hypothetical protein
MNFKKSLVIIFLAIGAIAFFVSCTKIRDEMPVISGCGATNAKFIIDVNPIIQSYCAINSGCHGTSSVNGPGPLTSYAQISVAAANIKDAVVSGRMPLGATLSGADIQKIRCWVEAGAPNN